MRDIGEICSFLYDIPKFTSKNSLEHTRAFWEHLGCPGKNLKVIHVAGSNGKGSVCCFLSNMLLASGKTVGLFTSPHLVDIRERFRINGALVSEELFVQAFEQVKQAADDFVEKKRNHPTFFEFIFAMGMVIFEQAQTEYAVLETGLGGRLDCTNIFPNPILTVITSISLEHTEILGDTLTLIAGEKAGIIKPGVPVVYDANEPEADAVIRKRAGELGSPCQAVTRQMYDICEIHHKYIDFYLVTDYDNKRKWRIPFSAAYQAENASVAITAFHELGIWDEDAVQQGLDASCWPGRMQEVLPEVYFDGAHNPSGIGVFLEAAKEISAGDDKLPCLLFSMVKDKDYATSVQMLTEKMHWDAMAVTTIPGERGVDYTALQKIFEEDTARPVLGYADYREAFFRMRKRKRPGQKLFCTGSLYFIGALMELVEECKEEENDQL